MKPRVMSLVLFTCMVGLLISPSNITITSAIISLFAVAMGSGAAGALNMWYESDLDALMSRTCLRPIPTGKIKKNQALYFGVILSIVSTTILYFSANFVSASLLLFTIFFYFLFILFGLRKKNSPFAKYCYWWSSWCVTTCYRLDNNYRANFNRTNYIVFNYIFLTFHIFWALSLYKAGDYKRAKIPMLPITAGVKKTKKNILLYAIAMVPAVLAPFFLDIASIFIFQFLY